MRKQKKIAGMIILILASLGLGGCDSREPIQTQPASKGSAESVSAELSSGAVVEIFSFSELKGSRFVFSSGAGAWQTELTVAEDGSFQGSFQDVNMGTPEIIIRMERFISAIFKGSLQNPKNGMTIPIRYRFKRLVMREKQETKRLQMECVIVIQMYMDYPRGRRF